jgi:hypothetical protein
MRAREPLALTTALRSVAWSLPVFGGLCLAVAALRFLQAASSWWQTGVLALFAEILVLMGRLGLVLAAVGNGSLGAGVRAIRGFFRQPRSATDARFAQIRPRLREHGRSLVFDLLLFVALAIVGNLLIGALASTSLVIEWASMAGATPDQAANGVTLLLKNLTVIPLTILFQVHFAARLWLAPEERRAWLARPRAKR